MRHVSKALILIAVLTAVAGGLWSQRIPAAEWLAGAYLSHAGLSHVQVSISELGPRRIHVDALRFDHVGTVGIKDAQIDLTWTGPLAVTVSAIHIGELATEAAFPSLPHALDLVMGGGDKDATAALDLPPLPEITLDALDLYLETPHGYLLASGSAALPRFNGGPRERLLETAMGKTPSLDLTVAVGFSDLAIDGAGTASGTASWTVSLSEGVATLRSDQAPLLHLVPGPELTSDLYLPEGLYSAEAGNADQPLVMRMQFADIPPSGPLFPVVIDPFPLLLETPFGPLSASVRLAPLDPGALMAGELRPNGSVAGKTWIAGLPLPGLGTMDLKAALSVPKIAEPVLEIAPGAEATITLMDDAVLSGIPESLGALVQSGIRIETSRSVKAAFTGTREAAEVVLGSGVRVTAGTVSATVDGGLTAALGPDGVSLTIPRLGIEAGPDPNGLSLPEPVRGDFADITFAQTGTRNTFSAQSAEVETPTAKITGILRADKTDNTLRVGLSGGTLSVKPHGLSVPAIDVTGVYEDSVLTLDTLIEQVLLGDTAALKMPVSARTTVKPAGDGHSLSSTGTVADLVGFQVDGDVSPGGDVALRFSTDSLTLGTGGAGLSDLTDVIDLGAMRPRGTVRASGSLTRSGDALAGDLALAVQETGSRLGDGSMVSVDGTVRFDLLAFPATTAPSTLTGRLESPYLGAIPFRHTFSIRPTGEIDLHRLSAEFLGGTIRISDTVADPSRATGSGTIAAQGIDLGSLADLLAIDGLETSGRLTGSLGFRVSEDTITVEAGRLAASEPGVLRYTGAALRAAARGDDNLTLLVQALENFHYDGLSLAIDIPEFGEGLITLHLEGNNPDVLDGHPFDVTINLESDYGKLIRTFLDLLRELDLVLQGSIR